MSEELQPQQAVQTVEIPQGVQVQTQQPVTQEAVPQAPAPVTPNAIPYDRFSEVVSERNQIRDQYNRLSERLDTIAMSQADKLADPVPQFDNVEQLIAWQDKRIESKLQSKLTEAYEKHIAPIKQASTDAQFLNNVENYFARKPEASQNRQAMDAYTATLSPGMKDALKQDIQAGNFGMLDSIYQHVSVQNQAQQSQQVAAQQKQEVNNSFSPQPYKQYKVQQPGIGDYRNEQIDYAQKTGKNPNFNPVWGAVLNDAFAGNTD